MSEKDDKKNETAGEGVGSGEKVTKTEKEFNITVDTKNVEAILERLKEQEQKNKELQAEFDKVMKAKEGTETKLEEETTVREDYETKLKLLAEEKLTKKKDVLLDEAKKVIKDEERLKQLEEEIKGIKDPEKLKATEFLIQTFVTSFKKGEEEEKELEAKEKKKVEEDMEEKEGGKGTLSLSKEQKAQETGEETKVGYESHAAMIRELRKKLHSDKPEEIAWAKSVLDELWKKFAAGARAEYEGKAPHGLGNIGPKGIKGQPSLRDMTKKGGEAI